MSEQTGAPEATAAVTTETPPAGVDPSQTAAPDATADAPDAQTAAPEVDVDALVAEKAKESAGLRAALTKARSDLREARAEASKQGRQQAQSRRAAAQPSEDAEADEDFGVESVPQFRTREELDSYFDQRVKEQESRWEAQRTQREQESRYRELRDGAIEDLRESVSTMRQQVMPSLEGEAGDLGDLLMWAVLQQDIAQQAQRANVDDAADYLMDMDEGDLAKSLGGAVRGLKSFAAALTTTQTTANDEAGRDAPLTSGGVAAERQDADITNVNDPRFLEKAREVATSLFRR
jgi:hypothetical protein